MELGEEAPGRSPTRAGCTSTELNDCRMTAGARHELGRRADSRRSRQRMTMRRNGGVPVSPLVIRALRQCGTGRRPGVAGARCQGLRRDDVVEMPRAGNYSRPPLERADPMLVLEALPSTWRVMLLGPRFARSPRWNATAPTSQLVLPGDHTPSWERWLAPSVCSRSCRCSTRSVSCLTQRYSDCWSARSSHRSSSVASSAWAAASSAPSAANAA